MTMRARTTKRPSIRTRIGRQFEGEDRQQAVVTVIFAIAIAAVVLILVGAMGLAYYNDHLRPLAKVGPVDVGPQLLRDRVALEQWRINLEGNRLTQAQIDNEIDADTYAAKQSALQQRSTDLTTTALPDLVDEIYQSQLAPPEGISVTEADVDAAVAKEFASQEQRHVLGILVKPVSAEGEGTAPSLSEQRAALEKAEAALAALNSGRDFADVAKESSSADNAQTGGDYGNLTEITVPEENWGAELFRLELNGTTDVIRGTDGSYYIGRVTEISPAGEQAGLREDLTKTVSEAALRDMLRYQVGADKLSEKITDAALAETPEQAHIAIIYIEGAYTDDPVDAQGEIDYSEIVFAPNDDLEVAPELPEGDTAWEAARVEAQATFDELNAIPVGDERDQKFKDIAIDKSDSPTGPDGGAVGFVTRSIPPDAIGNALFDTAHNEGDLIGPVRADAAWYVLQFHERRESPEQRVKEVSDLLAQPDADFAQIATDHSDGPEADDGGEVGWITRDQLAADLVDPVFNLSPGQVSEPLELGEGHYFVKVLEKGSRPLDPDQIPDIRANAFADWYQPKLDQAKLEGVVIIVGESASDNTGEDLTGGD
jgi:parvulin-like peptidyl-prolyl isomerase